MRPGAGERDEQRVAPGLDREAGRTIGAHLMAKGRIGALEHAAGLGRVIPDVVPDAVDQHSHDLSPAQARPGRSANTRSNASGPLIVSFVSSAMATPARLGTA